MFPFPPGTRTALSYKWEVYYVLLSGAAGVGVLGILLIITQLIYDKAQRAFPRNLDVFISAEKSPVQY